MKIPLHAVIATALLAPVAGADPDKAAQSVNTFGLELHQRIAAAGGNRVFSPWSIQSALAMTYAGAAGDTRDEMAATLHFAADEAEVHGGFAAIAADLVDLARRSRERVEAPNRPGGPNTPLEIVAANRLFGQDGHPFEKPFLDLVRETYGAPLEIMDFIKSPEPSRVRINDWVAGQTKDRIKDLIPQGLINEDTRLVLTNAIYMKAAWADEFEDEADSPFFADGGGEIKVPGLVKQRMFGYRKIPGGAVVAVPYADGGLQFLLMIPDEKNGLTDLEKALTPDILKEAANLESREIRLHFPEFKLEPDSVLLADHLIAMGMPGAFDKPPGSADFSRMAPRKPDDYLCISEVVHKAFIAVDKYGTEAAAATAVIMMRATAALPEPVEPMVIRADRPFAFAIQHRKTGTCLFLGRVTDPR
jgi:serpin B